MRGIDDGTAWLAQRLGVALVVLGMVAATITLVLRRSGGRPAVHGVAAIGLAVLFTAASQLLCLSIIGRGCSASSPRRSAKKPVGCYPLASLPPSCSPRVRACVGPSAPSSRQWYSGAAGC